jgi:predicted RNA-binding protein with PUA-like domain
LLAFDRNAAPPARLRLARRPGYPAAMASFLFKTEPSTYSFSDLVRERRTVWDGVTNPVALRNLRTVKKGDQILIYHTGDEKSVIGLATAASDAYPDPRAPKRTVVDLAPERILPVPVPLAAFRSDPTLRTSEVARMPRLSVVPLSGSQFKQVLKLAGD